MEVAALEIRDKIRNKKVVNLLLFFFKTHVSSSITGRWEKKLLRRYIGRPSLFKQILG